MVQIRPATPDDAEAIGVVHMAAWRETYGHLLSESFFAEHTPEASVARWRRTLARVDPPPVVHVAVAESGDSAADAAGPNPTPEPGRVLGFVWSGPSFTENAPRDRELYALYVLASQHGTGVGQRLLDTAIGDSAVSLWVAEDNPRATAFYRRNGFEFDGTRDVVPSMENIVELRMVR